MSELSRVDTALLEVIAGMKDGKAEGAFNIRKDSGCAGRVNTENVTITTKTDKPGIDIRFVPGCKDSCHIPVIITESGLRETVYNDFTSARARTSRSLPGAASTTAARTPPSTTACIRSMSAKTPVSSTWRSTTARATATAKNVMNPTTIVYLEEGASMQMDMSQIGGIDSTRRDTRIACGKDADVVITERLLTHGSQRAESDMIIELNGENSAAA